MEAGPRLMAVVILIAIMAGFWNSASTSFDFEAAYQTILKASALSCCLKLISEQMEEWIMERVRAWEDKVVRLATGLMLAAWSGIVACIRGMWAMIRRDTFPPVIDV